MPQKTSAKKIKGIPPKKCYPNRHQTASEYLVYDLMCAFSHKDASGRLMFTASVVPTVCNALNISKNWAHTTIAHLHEEGWLKWHGRKRKADGTESPNAWEIVSHEAFVAAHPGSCPLYQYVPDRETAEAYGLKIGDKIGGTRPLSFNSNLFDKKRLVDAPGAQLLYEVTSKWWDGLSEAEREDHIRTLKSIPAATEEATTPAIVGEATTPAIVGEATTPAIVGEATTPAIGDRPLPQSGTDHSRNRVLTTPTIAGGIPVPSYLEKQTDYYIPPTPPDGGGKSAAVVFSPIEKGKSVAEQNSWLGFVWADSEDLPEPYTDQKRTLKLRANGKDEEIRQLVKEHGLVAVQVAWARFAKDSSPVYFPDTKYPVSVFLKHATSYLQGAAEAWFDFKNKYKEALAVLPRNRDQAVWYALKEAEPAMRALMRWAESLHPDGV